MYKTMLMITRSYFDILRVRNLISWQEMGFTFLSEAHPITGFDKFESLKPDVLILQHNLSASDIQCYIEKREKSQLATQIVLFTHQEMCQFRPRPWLHFLDWDNLTAQCFFDVIKSITKTLDTRQQEKTTSDSEKGETEQKTGFEALIQKVSADTFILLRIIQKEKSLNKKERASLCHGVTKLLMRYHGGIAFEEQLDGFGVCIGLPEMRNNALVEAIIHDIKNLLQKRITKPIALLKSEICTRESIPLQLQLLNELEQIHFFCSEVFVLSHTYVSIYRRINTESSPYLVQRFLVSLLCGDLPLLSDTLSEIYLRIIKPTMDDKVLAFYRKQIFRCIRIHLTLQQESLEESWSRLPASWTIEEELQELISLCSSLISTYSKPVHAYSPLVAQCLILISNRYVEPISLNDLAEELKVSKSYLSRAFNKAVGLGVVAYLQQVRIEAAKSMMMNGTASIRVIAQNNGFLDPQYFTRVFRQIEGMSPSAYIELLSK